MKNNLEAKTEPIISKQYILGKPRALPCLFWKIVDLFFFAKFFILGSEEVYLLYKNACIKQFGRLNGAIKSSFMQNRTIT